MSLCDDASYFSLVLSFWREHKSALNWVIFCCITDTKARKFYIIRNEKEAKCPLHDIADLFVDCAIQLG